MPPGYSSGRVSSLREPQAEHFMGSPTLGGVAGQRQGRGVKIPLAPALAAVKPEQVMLSVQIGENDAIHSLRPLTG